MNFKYALTGNPNVGKTSIYNRLTHSSRHVGNWHGVTVDVAQKQANFGDIYIVDLPGLYSLTVYSTEEAISRDAIFGGKNDLIINVCDANNLARNLYLALQLMELGAPLALAINMMDELSKRGFNIDKEKLQNRLDVPVTLLSAKYKLDGRQILEPLSKYATGRSRKYNLPYINKLPLAAVKRIVGENIKKSGLDENFTFIKVLEGDEFIIDKLDLSNEQKGELNALGDNRQLVASLRYEYIDSVLDGIFVPSKQRKIDKVNAFFSTNADKILLNKYLAFPIFILIMSGIFWVTFGFIGDFFTNILEKGIDYLVSTAYTGLTDIGSPKWITALVSYGMFEGVGSVIVFLPQIVILFFFLALLEDSGYISRLAFMTDGMFRKIGLSGRAVFTMIMGLGCSATAVPTARGLEDEMMRKKTVVLTPFMSCSARLPVYTAIAGAFFTSGNILLIVGLYVLGAIVVVSLAALMERTALSSGEASFIMEMPQYRLPTAERVLQIIGNNAKNFIVRVGTTVFMLNVIVWILCNFSLRYGFVQVGSGHSIMEGLGALIAPVFSPLGFGNWKAVTALLSGLVAKEVVISTITGLGGVSEVLPDSLAAICFLVYTLLYVPCIATLGAVKKEAGTKWMLLGLIMQLSVAYIVTLTVRVTVLAFNFSIAGGIAAIAFAISATVAIYLAMGFMFKKRRCIRCTGECNNCT